MIHLIRSHNLSILSEALAEKLTEKAPDDPFVSQKIIVPNLDTARWFKLFAAERNGIAANLECMLPAEWFWKQIRNIYPDLPDQLPSDHHPMKWSLFKLLSEKNTRSKFEVIERYLLNQPKERAEQALFQLSAQIASVFDEYLVYRPGMVLKWQKGESGEGDEKWQADLWRLLNQMWRESGDTERKNRAELYDDALKALSEKKIETDDPLFVLNPGLLSLPTVKLLKNAGNYNDIFLYQIQVSKELANSQNELVQVLGGEAKSVRDVIHFLEPDNVSDLETYLTGNDLLHRIQADIFSGRSTKKETDRKDDIKGIEIRSCHSPLREIEVLHQFLLEKFEEDETLYPDDILVATPDLETYRPYIQAVFDQPESDLPSIPYHAGYSFGKTEKGIERALRRLLSVIDSRFEFENVMDLFMMRPVFRSYGLSESDTVKLKRWIEENNVVWGVDAEHRKEFDQPAEDLHTWNSALRRGWYGHFLGGDKGEMVDGILPYRSIRSTNDQQIWAAFTAYMNQLNAMRRDIKKKKSITEWAEWIINKTESLFDNSFMERKEAQIIRRVIAQIDEQCQTGFCEEKISFSLFKSELTSKLDRQKASGARFTNGITFSSMVPVRSLPFKVIALIGLNENKFPRKKITPDFDLMTRQPQPGERNRKNEDRNLFLESIMSAGEIHYCSYIGQSREDNEEIPPSTIVNEWIDLLADKSGLPSTEIVKKEMLSGFSPVNFKLGKSFSRIYHKVATHIQSDENSISGLTLKKPIPLDQIEASIQLDDLIQFFSNPIKWFLRKRFDVSLRDSDQKIDEFNLDHLELHLLFQRMFAWMMDGMPEKHVYKYLVKSGSVPVGWAGEREVIDLKKSVQNALSTLKGFGIEPRHESISVALTVENFDIEGDITSYSTDQFVDISPSNFSGKVALHSWIRHLCCLISGRFPSGKSLLFSDLKKGEPMMNVFNPVEDPKEVLLELIDFYREGLTHPQSFFPKTLYAFEERERDEHRVGSYYQAAKAFNTNEYSFGESHDLAIQAFFGEEIEFHKEFIQDRYRHIIGRMMDSMEEG